MAFARFETRAKEVERARAIYKYALDCIPKAQASTLYASFVQFEKQHGDRKGVEDVIIAKRRFKYEDDIKTDPLNYDVWFDYIRLEEAEGEVDRARELFERAIAQVTNVLLFLMRARLSLQPDCGVVGCALTVLPRSHPVPKSARGGATCFCGSSTPCSRSWTAAT